MLVVSFKQIRMVKTTRNFELFDKKVGFFKTIFDKALTPFCLITNWWDKLPGQSVWTQTLTGVHSVGPKQLQLLVMALDSHEALL